VAAPVFRDIAGQALSYMNIPRDEGRREEPYLVLK